MLEGGVVWLKSSTQQQYCAVVTRPRKQASRQAGKQAGRQAGGRQAGNVLQHHMCSQ